MDGRKEVEESCCNDLRASGYRRRPSHQRVAPHARERAATNFGLDLAELEDQHHPTFKSYEEGRLSLEEYLGRVVFYKQRPFTRVQLRRFMLPRSRPYPKMIEQGPWLKAQNGLKMTAVSIEGREQNTYRIRKSKLGRCVDSSISSCFVRIPKPDADIHRLAMDIAHAPAWQLAHIENALMFVRIAEDLGIRCNLHTDYGPMPANLASLGLLNDEGVIHETS
jgi:putative hydrolase of the HAD superfamily